MRTPLRQLSSLLFSVTLTTTLCNASPQDPCSIEAAADIVNRGLVQQYQRVQDQGVTFTDFLTGIDKGSSLNDMSSQAKNHVPGGCDILNAAEIINRRLINLYK